MATTFKIDTAGVGELLKSEGVRADLARRAEAIAGTAGEGWRSESGMSFKGDRAAAWVTTDDPKVIAQNKKNHTLMRSIDAGRN